MITSAALDPELSKVRASVSADMVKIRATDDSASNAGSHVIARLVQVLP